MTVPGMNLSELIRATKGDRSYDKLEEAAGGKPTAARWQQLATAAQRNFPDPPTIQGMAKALGVAEKVVVLAAARTLGLDATERESQLVALLPPGADHLSLAQIDAVRHVIRVMAEPVSAQTERAEQSAQTTREVESSLGRSGPLPTQSEKSITGET